MLETDAKEEADEIMGPKIFLRSLSNVLEVFCEKDDISFHKLSRLTRLS